MANRPIVHNPSGLEQLLQSKQLEVNSMLEVTQAINNNLSAADLFRIFEFILRAQLGINQLSVYIKGVKSNEWEVITNYGQDASKADIDVEKILVPIKSTTDTKGIKNEFVRKFQMIIPAYHKNEALAYALIGWDSKKRDLGEDSLNFIQTITNIIAVAIENKKLFNSQLEREGLRRELELAGQMQTLLVPKSLPQNDKIEMAAAYLPHDEVGGDYYDVFNIDDDTIALCIADISGKGIAAALLMSNFQATLRALIYQDFPLATLISILNRRIVNITGGEKFITLFIGMLNLKTKKFKYINAGHNPPFLYHDGKITQLDKGSTILGMFENLPKVDDGEVTIKKNSILLYYTDGLVDLENEKGETFEPRYIRDFIMKNHALSMEEFKDRLVERLDEYRGNKMYTDDVTILASRIF